ncbi:MAG: hypothetical protein AAFQ23_11905 [Cyanobacteria bacterium J06623_1]
MANKEKDEASKESNELSEMVSIGNAGVKPTAVKEGIHILDVGDTEAIGSDGILTSISPLMHETTEAFEYQVVNPRNGLESGQKSLLAAHLKGLAMESKVSEYNFGTFRDVEPRGEGSIVKVNSFIGGEMRSIQLIFNAKNQLKKVKNNTVD